MKKLIVSLWTMIGSTCIGCASTPVFNTQSGKPEVTIPGVTKKQVTEALMSRMIGKGWQVKKTSDYEVSFYKTGQSVMVAMAFGSSGGGAVEHDANYSLLDGGNGVRIICSIEIVAAPGQYNQMSKDATMSESGQSCQDGLDAIKAELVKH